MGFGESIQKELKKIYEDNLKDLGIDSDSLVEFTEHITDQTLSKQLSYQILDYISLGEEIELLNIVLREYRKRCVVLSISLREYPELFNRRIYIPMRYTLEDLAYSILSSLRIADYEDFYLLGNQKRMTLNGENQLKDYTAFDIRDFMDLSLYYGKDSWCFDIKLIGLTYYEEHEIELPYLVLDAVGYGIMGMRKYRLFDMLDESKELSLDTKNPLMDDEDFEFYNADTDSLNENANEDYLRTKEEYQNKNTNS